MILEGMRRFDRTLDCGSLEAALVHARDAGPDLGLIVLDLGLPDTTGLEGLDRLVEGCPSVPVIVVSGGDDKPVIEAALARGARGYVPKNSSAPAFRAAVEAVLRGERYVPPHVLGAASAGAPRADAAERLTPRQEDVLLLLAQGLANKEIARELDMSPATVRVHVTALFKALGVENRTQAAISETAQRLLARKT